MEGASLETGEGTREDWVGWHACKPSLVTPVAAPDGKLRAMSRILSDLVFPCPLPLWTSSPAGQPWGWVVCGHGLLGRVRAGARARPPPPKRQSHAKRAQCLCWRVSKFRPGLSCERGERRPPRFPFPALEFYHRPPIHVDPGIDEAVAAMRRAFRAASRKWLSRSPLL